MEVRTSARVIVGAQNYLTWGEDMEKHLGQQRRPVLPGPMCHPGRFGNGLMETAGSSL